MSVPKTPVLIRKETHFNFGNVSNVLKLLRDKEIVKCINPEDHKGKLYKLTENGEKILKELKKL